MNKLFLLAGGFLLSVTASADHKDVDIECHNVVNQTCCARSPSAGAPGHSGSPKYTWWVTPPTYGNWENKNTTLSANTYFCGLSGVGLNNNLYNDVTNYNNFEGHYRWYCPL